MKHNKDAKKRAARQTRTAEAQRQLALARELVSARATGEQAAGRSDDICHTVLVCVDLEWYEADQNRLLEIGWSCWDSVGGSITSRWAPGEGGIMAY